MASRVAIITIVLVSLVLGAGAQGQQPVSLNISIKDHRFKPTEITAPANVLIILQLRNLDPCRWSLRASAYAWKR